MGYNKKYADWSKKIWFEIVAPSLFNEQILGETPAYKSEQVIERKIDLNLALITGNFKLQNMRGIFQIYNVKGHKAITDIIEISLYDAYIRRIVRKGTNRIDDSFVVETKDGVKVRVKPLIITRFRTTRRRRAAIRNTTREFLINKIKEIEYYEVLKKIMEREFQNELFPILNKIYPITNVEIRRFVRETPLIKREKQILIQG